MSSVNRSSGASISSAGNDDEDYDDDYKAEKTRLELEEEMVSQRVKENRDMRIAASRKLEQTRRQGYERQKRYDDVEKDLLLLHKRELYEHIIQERLAEEEIKRKMENLELEQRLILLKLEEIEELNSIQKDRVDSGSMKEMVEQTFEPALKRMKDIPDVAEIIKRNSESSNFYAEVSAKVSNELQLALRTSHAQSKEQLTLKRKELINERFEKEARLQEIRELLHEENSANDDEDFQVSYERAKTLEVSVREYIGHVNERIDKVNSEVDWLRDNPSSDFWQDLKNRVMRFSKEELALSAEPYLNYMKMRKERESIVETQTLNDDTSSAALQVGNAIFLELVKDELSNLATELINIKVVTSSILDNVIVGSVCQDGSFRIDKEDVTGKSNLFIGMMNDMRRDFYSIGCNNAMGTPSFDVKRSQQLIDAVNKTSTPCDEWRAVPQSVLHLMDALRGHTYDRSKLKPLVQAEKKYWKDIKLTKVSTLHCPNIDFMVHMKVFPRKMAGSSLIVVGSSSGRLAIWLTPWLTSEPYLVAVTPELPKRERAPVVDIKEGTLNNLQILYLLGNGHVRVWSINEIPKPSAKKVVHTSDMFPSDKTTYVPHTPVSVFHMVPADMNMPASKDTNVTKAIAKKEKQPVSDAFGLQPGLQPTSISFHPSLSLLGLNTSVLIGSEGGDMLKFNIDTKNSAVDAPIVHLPPFIDREYTHPANARNDVVIARSLPNTKGNKVSRELFHFHKTKIIFIDVVMKTSDKIITIDESGTLAIWKYAPQYFEQRFWFRPEASFALDLGRVEFENASATEACAAPTEVMDKKLLRVRIRDKDADGNTSEEFSPVRVKDRDVVYICQTNEKTEQKKWLCKYGRLVQYFARFDDVRSSNDGTRVFFMVTYSTDSKFGSNAKTFNSLVGFDTEQLKFDPPFVKFQIDTNDSVCNYHIGPILAETLTRFVFIHTKTTLRVISLETASEIVNDTFPFKTKSQNFNPILSALCPTQRMVVFGSVEDARMIVYDLDRQGNDSPDLLNRQVLDGLRSDPQYLSQFAMSTTQGRSALDLNDFNRANKSLVDVFMQEIINDCIDRAARVIEVNFSKKTRAEYLKGFYGDDNFGVIAPVGWPDSDSLREPNDKEMDLYKKFLE